jgi:hypothetical protein
MSHEGPGLFVNRNHQATFLLIAIPLAAYWLSGSSLLRAANRPVRLALMLGIGLVFAAAIVATTSRAGLILTSVAAISAWLIMREGKTDLRIVLLALFPLALLIGAAGQLPTVQQTLVRFSQDEEGARPQIWAHGAQAARLFWPSGSGLGSFAAIYPIVEPHDELAHAYVNNAHNDYIETWLEGGALTIGVIAVLLGSLAYSTRRRFRPETDRQGQREAIAALSCLLILALHSTADYPLRMMSIMAMAGMAGAMLLAMPEKRRRSRAPLGPMAPDGRDGQPELAPHRSPVVRAVAGLALLALLWPVWSLGLAQDAIDRGDPGRALAHCGYCSDAFGRSADNAFVAGDYANARAHARRALALAPLNAGASAVLVQALRELHQDKAADRLLVSARHICAAILAPPSIILTRSCARASSRTRCSPSCWRSSPFPASMPSSSRPSRRTRPGD